MSKLESAVRVLEAQEPDEISILFRSSKGNYGYASVLQQISTLSETLTTPLSVGGFSSLQGCPVTALFNAGADKLIVNSLLYSDPSRIRTIASEHGAQSISAAVDLELVNNRLMARAETLEFGIRFLEINDWIQLAINVGVGELQLTSVDYDGSLVTEQYLEKTLPQFVSTGLPIVYGGGCYSVDTFFKAFSLGVSGVSAGSFFLKKDQNLSELKAHLYNKQLPVRPS